MPRTKEEVKLMMEAREKDTLARLKTGIWFNDSYLNAIYGRFFGPITRFKSWYGVVEDLQNREFTYTIPLDENRYLDGLKFRKSIEPFRSGPCTVLEMICGLADRMETEIMQNTLYGDRTGQWVTQMVNSMGLCRLDDDHYDKRKSNDIITRFLNREYEPNGKGGLFTFRKPVPGDPREVEIWWQMQWWLSENY